MVLRPRILVLHVLADITVCVERSFTSLGGDDEKKLISIRPCNRTYEKSRDFMITSTSTVVHLTLSLLDYIPF